jgi:hypothetical protein
MNEIQLRESSSIISFRRPFVVYRGDFTTGAKAFWADMTGQNVMSLHEEPAITTFGIIFTANRYQCALKFYP